MGNKYEEVEICVKGCNVRITEMRWDCSQDCSAARKGCRLGRQGGGVALCVRAQLEYIELCLGMEPAESLRVSITKQTNMGDVLVAVCYRWSEQEE